MRYITLTETEEQELAQLYKRSQYIVERQRSQCILLSHQGKSIKELSQVFGVSRLTITKWLDRWQQGGKAGILLPPGRGRKKKLSGLAAEPIEAYVAEHNRNLNAVVALLKEKHAVAVSRPCSAF
jgi:transposase